MTTRDDLRNAILNSDQATVQTQVITFFGQQIELRQPTVGQIEKQANNGGNSTLSNMLIEYAYVPGTNDKVFEDTDADTLKGLPFNQDVQAATAAVTKLTGIDVSEAAKK
jgi:hypothetical protein